jgi:hypothetical protein
MVDFEIFEHFMGHEEKTHEGDATSTYAYLKARIDEGSTLNCLEIRDVGQDEMHPAPEWFKVMQEALVQYVVYEAMVLANTQWVSGTSKQAILDAAIESTNKILEILR